MFVQNAIITKEQNPIINGIFQVPASPKLFWMLGLNLFMLRVIGSEVSSSFSRDSLRASKIDEMCGSFKKSGSIWNRCCNGSASLMSLFIAKQFLQKYISAFSSIRWVSIFVPHFNSNTNTWHPRIFVRSKCSVLLKSLRKISKFFLEYVISRLPLPRCFAFSIIGRLTIKILQICNAENWFPTNREPRHVFSAVYNDKPFTHKKATGTHTVVNLWFLG